MFDEYAQYYDLINSDKPYKQEIEFVYEWAQQPKIILDLGCGTADYWQYFPLEKVSIMGVEQSQAMINNAKFPVTQGSIFELPRLKIQACDCAYALFDVINYLRHQRWWKHIPLKKGGYFIFDIWDLEKVLKDGFTTSVKRMGGFTRTIRVLERDKQRIALEVVGKDKFDKFSEIHVMYLYSQQDIKDYCGKDFEIVEIRQTQRWQTWYKLRRL